MNAKPPPSRPGGKITGVNAAKTGTKLTIAFLAVALIVVGVAAVGYVSIQSINAGLATLYADRLVCAQQLGNVSDAALNIQKDLYRCLLVPEEQEELERDIAGHIKLANENIKQYEATHLVPDEEHGLAEFRPAWAGYLQAVEESLRQVKAGNPQAALQSVDGGAVFTAQHAVEHSLDELIKVQVRVGIAVKQDGDRTFARAGTIMVAAGVMGVLLAIGLGVFLGRGITLPLARITEVARSVSGGDLDAGALAGIATRRDEIGMLAGAFTLMTGQLKEQLEGLRRLNRELRAIGNCNQTLLRAKDEQTLLDEVCRIICNEAGYRMAWVGLAGQDEAKTVRPAAWAGVEDDYLKTAGIVWSDTERGRDPAGTAIRTGKISQVRDFATDPAAGPWRTEAARRGYHSNLALPLKDETGAVFGALTIYSAAPEAFTPDEIRLLEELAGDLAFGMVVLRMRTERQRAEEKAAENQERFKLIFDSIPVGVALARQHPDGRFERVINDAHLRICGLTREQDQIPGIYRQLTHPEDAARQAELGRPLNDGHNGQLTMEKRYLRLDGTVVWVTFTFRREHCSDGSIEELTTVVDITAQKLASDEIRRLNAELEQRVRDRTAELTAANQELESFSFTVSHDLRAPLRALIGFSQALVEDCGPALTGESRGYLRQITAAAQRMRELVDGLLVLSRCTRGGMGRDPIDLSALCERIRQELTATEPDRKVEWRIQPGLTLRGDGRMFEAVMGNLLGNAWKYTGRQSAPVIRVWAEVENGQRHFHVADNGAGFDMEHAKVLFQPFQRLHRQDEFPGIGIGLATVQRILHRHGGTIRATATPGQGATFSFSLPETTPPER